jgi:hypothetical protein
MDQINKYQFTAAFSAYKHYIIVNNLIEQKQVLI